MSENGCLVDHGLRTGRKIEDWWTDRLDLRILRRNSHKSNPMDRNFDYRKEFESLDFAKVKKEVHPRFLWVIG